MVRTVPPGGAGQREQLGQLDQLVYRWSARTLTGDKGYKPVATSVEASELAGWMDLVGGQAEPVDADDDHPHPPTALTYLVKEDRAALIHKIRLTGYAQSRDRILAHVLLGPAAVLTPRLALAQHQWSWAGAAEDPTGSEGYGLPKIDVSRLTAGLDDREREITRRAQELPDELTVIVHAVLDNARHGQPLSIILDGDGPVGQDDAAVLMWGAVTILEDILPASFPLTFATFEARHRGGAASPRFLFGPVRPAPRAGRVKQTRDVYLPGSGQRDLQSAGEPPESAVSKASEKLARAYCGEGPGEVVSIIDRANRGGHFDPVKPEPWCLRVLGEEGENRDVLGVFRKAFELFESTAVAERAGWRSDNGAAFTAPRWAHT